VEFLTSVEIVHRFCIWITYYPVMQGTSKLCITPSELRNLCDCHWFWLYLFSWPMNFIVQYYIYV